MIKLAYSFRAGCADDAEAIMACHRRSILGLGRSAYTEAETESWAAGLKPEGYVRMMRERDELFDLAVAESGVVVGFCSTLENEVMALYVDPDWARLGIASALLKRAEARLGARDHENVVIHAAISGLPFYLAHGYAVEQQKLWETRGGLMLATASLRKVL